MHSSLAIANEFIRRANVAGRPLTHMQIQKLTYLAHGWTLAVTGEPLIEDEIEAWDFGPVIRKLYQALRRYGPGPVTRPIRWGDDSPFAASDHGEEATEVLIDKERQVIEKVWENYGKFAGFQLSALTHMPGTPWDAAYEPKRNRAVANNAIQEYFVRLADAPQ